jgi:hypothetical protein
LSEPSSPIHSKAERSILFGLVNRRERWSLSLRGFLVLLLLLCASTGLFLWAAYPFFGVTKTVPANILIAEGWAPPWAMVELAEEYKRRPYDRVLIVRSVLDPDDHYDLGWSNSEYAIRALVKNGVPEERVAKVVTVSVFKDRTYHSALGAKEWLATNNIAISGINVATVGPHARRSRLLYKRAFGPDVPLGIISLSPRSYNRHRWWTYSEGVREMIGEIIAFVYARFLFSAD